MAQVAIGNKPNLTIFGGDYNTVDGTGWFWQARNSMYDLASNKMEEVCDLIYPHISICVYNNMHVEYLHKP
jgi:UDP-glucose 4-epimerase